MPAHRRPAQKVKAAQQGSGSLHRALLGKRLRVAHEDLELWVDSKLQHANACSSPPRGLLARLCQPSHLCSGILAARQAPDQAQLGDPAFVRRMDLCGLAALHGQNVHQPRDARSCSQPVTLLSRPGIATAA
eukprot:5047714-Lingulodinium_polyedra.AAC.1